MNVIMIFYKVKYSLGLIILMLILSNSCQSNSRSGRAKMISTAMAKKEANKKKSKPTPNTIKKDILPKVIEIDEVVTPKEKSKINKELLKKKIPTAKGSLIQIEGLVFKEVAELTIKLQTTNSQIEQILAMKNYVNENWHYIFDPKTSQDTWRSAEATISLKYKGKYSGDCDDFAILMASFARQVGLDSRVIGAYKNDGSGHAFAEFLVPKRDPLNPLLNGKDSRTDYEGKWVSLDWFKGAAHRAYKNNLKIIVDN